MLKLSDEARGRLLGLQRGMGYQDLLDIGEKLCQMEETELLKMDRSKGVTAEAILSKQDQCRGFRLFFETLQMEVDRQVNALIEGQEGPRQGSREAGKQGNGQGQASIDAEEAADMLGLIPERESQI